MGGNAAKERRRQKRLDQANSGTSNNSVKKSPTPASKSTATTVPAPSSSAAAVISKDATKPNTTTNIPSSSGSGNKDIKKQRTSNDKSNRRENNSSSPGGPRKFSNLKKTTNQNHKRDGTRNHSKVTNNNNEGRRQGSKNGASSSSSSNKNPKKKTQPSKKYKKPKHLARKLKITTDPAALQQLQKLQDELGKVKAKRINKFEATVVKMVGGKQNFNKEAFESYINGGGTKLETIVNAAKIEATPSPTPSETNEKKRKSRPKQDTATTSSDMNGDKKKVMKTIPPSIVEESCVNTEVKLETADPVVEAIQSSVTEDDEGTNTTQIVTPSSPKKNIVKDEGTDTTQIVTPSSPKKTIVKDEGTNTIQIETSPSPENADVKSKSESVPTNDADETHPPPTTRTRGRKRRGKVDADMKRDILNTQQQQNTTDGDTATTDGGIDGGVGGGTIPTAAKPKKKPLKCFETGKTYSGTVVYVKPQLGVFIDIGCHSDAFCHISRASDGFIETITDDLFKVGDILEDKIRVTDINSKTKKITVSLQSEDRIVDETSSSRAWRERKEERQQDKKKKTTPTSSDTTNRVRKRDALAHETKDKKKPVLPKVVDEVSVSPKDDKNSDTYSNRVTPEFTELDLSNMNPAEFKRARKLQRRAERRKQNEVAGASA